MVIEVNKSDINVVWNKFKLKIFLNAKKIDDSKIKTLRRIEDNILRLVTDSTSD